MNKYNSKAKLTITVNKEVLSEAKKVANERRIPISMVVENFLKFFDDPWVYCFKCGERFSVLDAKRCLECGWMICPKCGVCKAGISEETAIGVLNTIGSLEDLLAGRMKRS